MARFYLRRLKDFKFHWELIFTLQTHQLKWLKLMPSENFNLYSMLLIYTDSEIITYILLSSLFLWLLHGADLFFVPGL